MIDPTARISGQIDGVNPHLVTIGRKCVMGSKSAILTHCPIKGALPVSIGEYTWLGHGSIILPGVTVGACCIVGAGSVVSRDIPDGCIAAGNPARFIRELTPKEKHELVRRLELEEPMGKEG